jgi:hypothetical protein
MERGILITHDDCLDGATAALVARAVGLAVRLVEPDQVVAELQTVPEGIPLYLADVSIPKEAWPAWHSRVAYLLDHHQTALALRGEPRVTVDLGRSGARLMYDFAVEQGWLKPTPAYARLVDTVQRYDLWQPRHEAGQNLNRLFRDQGLDWYLAGFAHGWRPWQAWEADRLAEIVRNERRFIAAALSQVRRLQAGQFSLAGLFLAEDGPINEVAHRLLAEACDVVLFVKSDGRLSARSSRRVDVAQAMEQLFGGGGHARAAGGRLPVGVTPGPEAVDQALGQLSHFLADKPEAR